MSDELHPDAQRLLALARSDDPLPEAAQLASVRRSVLLKVGVAAAAGAAASTLAPSTAQGGLVAAAAKGGAAVAPAAGAAAPTGAAIAGAAVKGAPLLAKPAGSALLATLASSTGAKILAPLAIAAAVGTAWNALPPAAPRPSAPALSQNERPAPTKGAVTGRAASATRAGAHPETTPSTDVFREGAPDEAPRGAPPAEVRDEGAPPTGPRVEPVPSPPEAEAHPSVVRPEALPLAATTSVAGKGTHGRPTSRANEPSAPTPRATVGSVAGGRAAPVGEPAPAPDATVRPAPEAAALPPAPPPDAAPAASAPPALQAQFDAMGRAQRALRDGRSREALEVLDANRPTLQNGALSEEYAAARVLALCGAGRRDEASTAAQAFFRAFPRSPLTPRVRASCAGKP